jgi:hypothetical protein
MRYVDASVSHARSVPSRGYMRPANLGLVLRPGSFGMDSTLPPFLRAHDQSGRRNAIHQHAIFDHQDLGSAHALWWPPTSSSSNDKLTLMLFIPGAYCLTSVKRGLSAYSMLW